MKKSRQIISLLLSVLMITALFTAVPFTADAAIASYGLYLGETEVTSENAADIFGDGKASYDNSTKTLTLDNPVIPGKAKDASGYTAKIYSTLDELTIKGSYLMTASEAKYAVDAKQVIFDGNFSLYGSESGVYAYGIKFNGGRAYCWGKTGQGVQTTKVLGVYNGIQRVEFTSQFSSAVYYGKEFYKDYEVNVTTPANYSYGTHCILDGNNGNADATTVVLENPANGPKSGTTGDCTWEFDPGTGIMTISGNGEMEDYKWSNETQSTNAPWWDFRDKIKSVVIGDGVTAVGKEAFEKCANLTSLSLGKSVKEIKYDSFYGCALTSLEISDSVETIGDSAFTHNSNLNNVSFGKNVKDIEGYAFYQDSGLTEVVLPDGVESVGYLAFGANNDLKKVTIPASVTYIREYAFGYITPDEKIEGFTIYGYPDTAAQTYAEENGFTFVALQAYDLWLGTTQVTSLNCDDILGDGGKAKFDPNTNTLTLNDPVIDGYSYNRYSKTCTIYSYGINNLTIKGSYAMTSASADYAVYNYTGSITLDGDFVFKGVENGIYTGYNLTVSGGTVTVESNKDYAVKCSGIFTVTDDVTKFKAQVNGEYGSAIYGYTEGVTLGSQQKITVPKNGFVGGNGEYGVPNGYYTIIDEYGNKPQKVVIEKTDSNEEEYYMLWLGSTLVTSDNKDDILNDGGKAKFDPNTNTLTLNDPVIPGAFYDINNDSCKIYSAIKDLTIKGSYKMTNASEKYSVHSKNLTLNGDFVFKSYNGFIVYNLIINGGTVDIESTLRGAALCCYDSLTITNDVTKVSAKTVENVYGGAVYRFIDEINLGSQLKITTPEGGYVGKIGVDCYTIFDKDGNDEPLEVVIEKTAAPARKIGDVNGDNNVDVLDAAIVQKYAAGKSTLTPEQIYAGDVNGDNNTDVLDAATIQKYAAGKITEFKKKS